MVQPPMLDFWRKDADPFVQLMHTQNGLWDECAAAPLGTSGVEALVVQFITAHAPDYAGPICGSSPHFDKAFLDAHMPAVANLFNHRVFDVSTLKQAWCQRYGEWFETGPQKPAAHRALPDILASIKAAQGVFIE